MAEVEEVGGLSGGSGWASALWWKWVVLVLWVELGG